MAWTEVLDATAVEQAELVRARKISSEELCRLYLDRIERLDPRVNAFVEVLGSSALRAARAKDGEARGGAAKGRLPPFHGVPVGIKDLNLVRFTRARFGSRALSLWSPFDDRNTAQIRRGGFVILGKLS